MRPAPSVREQLTGFRLELDMLAFNSLRRTQRNSKAEVRRIVRELLNVIWRRVNEPGRTFEIPGFGVFYLKHHGARRIRKFDGELEQLPPTYALGFRAAKALKGKLPE